MCFSRLCHYAMLIVYGRVLVVLAIVSMSFAIVFLILVAPRRGSRAIPAASGLGTAAEPTSVRDSSVIPLPRNESNDRARLMMSFVSPARRVSDVMPTRVTHKLIGLLV